MLVLFTGDNHTLLSTLELT